MLYTAFYKSPVGTIVMSSDGKSLTGLCIQKDLSIVENQDTSPNLRIFSETRDWLDIYFGGCEPGFTPNLSLCGTGFRQSVWQQLLTIPYGHTVSYGEIARRLGCRSAQAIGGAVGHNPIAVIVPCHRVVGSDGSLIGYAYGLERKRFLLHLEGVV